MVRLGENFLARSFGAGNTLPLMQSIHLRIRVTTVALVAVVCLLLGLPARAQSGSPNIVISQVYGGGGNSGATLKNDFIELFNRGSVSVSVSGWSVQYASSTGTSWQKTNLPAVSIPAGGYLLVQEAPGTGGTTNLPTPDVSATIAMSATAGKVALVNSSTALSGACPTSGVVDFVGFGAANCSEGSGPTATLSNTTAALRAANGCTDTDVNSSDFSTGAPNPRNSASPTNACLAATNPGVTNGNALTEIGGTVLLSALITPGANPASTGLSVKANLLSIAGSGAQSLFDDASNGDVTAGDNVFSFSYSLPGSVTAGTFTLAVSVTDAQGRSGAGTITLTVQPHAEVRKINELQGAGAASPIDPGQFIKTTGIVTARKSNGFFLQSLPTDVDGDANTSEGIFVYTAGAPPADAAVKNIVEVRGYVHEFSGNTEICGDTLCTIVETIAKLGTATDLPAPATITAADENALRADPNSLALEKYEGMRVTAASLTAVAPTEGSVTESSATSSSTGIFFTVVTGVPRPFREPGVAPGEELPAGSPCCVPHFDGNPELLRVDSDGQTGAAKIEVTSNAVLTGVVGVLDFGSGFYTILPDPGLGIVPSGNMSAAPLPAPDAHEVTVASFNLERFYDDTTTTSSGATLTTAAFKKRLAKASLAIRNVLNTPDILALEEMNNLTTLQSLAARISADAVAAGQPDPEYLAFLSEGNDPSFINVAFLVKKSRIDVVDVTQYGKDATYINPSNGQPDLVNDRPPLVLRANVKASGKELSIPLTVIANHLRSLSGLTDAVDGPRVRAKRAANAEFLANLIQGMQSDNVISVGDYNAYEFSDGYVDVMGTVMGTPAPAEQVVLSTSDLVNPDLTDLLTSLAADQRYSYSFDGSAQTLDHFLVNPNALSHVTRFAYARVDADFPESMRGDGTRPERVSDHDPGVAYIAVPVDNDPPVVAVTGVTEGATYLLGVVPTPGCSTTDAISGVATAATLSLTGGNATGVGQFTATCSGAVDKVGNAADPVSVHFTVAYAFGGFGSPLNSGGPFKSGSTVPVKFQLANGLGALITSTSAITAIQYSWNADCAGAPEGGWQTAASTGGSKLRFDATDLQFVFNWKTNGIAAGCYTLGVKLDDTTTRSLIVRVK